MINATRYKKVEPIVLLTLFLMCGSAPTARCQETCNSTICREVADVYDKTVNTSVNPCTNFFEYVCSGWWQNVVRKLSNSTTWAGAATFKLLDDAVPNILSKNLKAIRDFARANGSYRGFRESEVQPTLFFRSCLRAIRKSNWEQNILTLREFFHKVDLPFFDEPIDPKKTAFASLMKLALLFGVTPIFEVDVSDNIFRVSRTVEALNRPKKNLLPTDQATVWKQEIFNLSQVQELDQEIWTEVFPTLEAFHIRLSKRNILRMGRNLIAVDILVEHFMYQGEKFETVPFETWSEILQSTYFDLFDGHMGNLAKLTKDRNLTMVPDFFKSIVLLTRDPEMTPVFIDYLRWHLLTVEFKHLIRRTKCVFLKCDPIEETRPVKYCSILVSNHLCRGSFRAHVSMFAYQLQ